MRDRGMEVLNCRFNIWEGYLCISMKTAFRAQGICLPLPAPQVIGIICYDLGALDIFLNSCI